MTLTSPRPGNVAVETPIQIPTKTALRIVMTFAQTGRLILTNSVTHLVIHVTVMAMVFLTGFVTHNVSAHYRRQTVETKTSILTRSATTETVIMVMAVG
jgi:hypothetical protein